MHLGASNVVYLVLVNKPLLYVLVINETKPGRGDLPGDEATKIVIAPSILPVYPPDGSENTSSLDGGNDREGSVLQRLAIRIYTTGIFYLYVLYPYVTWNAPTNH